MLVLSRRGGEAILIDGGIRIVVLSVDKRGVRLGIEAPESIQIQREELVIRLAGENRLARSIPESEHWISKLGLLVDSMEPNINPRADGPQRPLDKT